MIIINIFLELIEIELVSIFKSSVVFGILLNGIVGKMYRIVLAVIENVFESRCPKITFSAEEDFHVLVNQNPHPDVKLTIVD